MKTVLFKLKKEKLEIWKNWLSELQSNPETLNTLKEEKMLFEFYSVFEIDENYYCFAGGEGEFKKSSDKQINIKHNEIKKECFEEKFNSFCDVIFLNN